MKSPLVVDSDPTAIAEAESSFSPRATDQRLTPEFQNILSQLAEISSAVAPIAKESGYTTTGPFTTHKTPDNHLYYTDGQLPQDIKKNIETAIDTTKPQEKQCYHNAKMIAVSVDEATYTEGYGFNKIPVKHAWITVNLKDPTIVEVTTPLYEYVGVPITNIAENTPNEVFQEWFDMSGSLIQTYVRETGDEELLNLQYKQYNEENL